MSSTTTGTTSSTSSVYSSSSRITGLYSSLDTDTLVKNMCSSQQTKIDKQEQQKTTYEWYDDAVSDVLSSVADFSNTYCSALGTSSMLKSSTYSSYSVTSDSSSNAVKVTASNTADVGNVSVKVSQLAVNANASSSGKVSGDGTSISTSNTTTLGNLSFKNKLQFDDDEISFTINGKVFTFNQNTTLQSMINTVNNDTTANVTMKYSRLTDKFTITADSDGEDSKVIIGNIKGNAFGEDGAFQIGTGTTANGQNSISEINGAVVEQDSNEFTIDGLTYELQGVTATSSDSLCVKQLAQNANVSSSVGVSSGSELSSDNSTALKDLAFKNALQFDSDGQLSFAINGKTFSFSQDTSLQDMLDTVNNDTVANVTMSYSRLKDAFTITADTGGQDSKVSISNIAGNAFGSNSAFQINTGTTQNGKNSIAIIDGTTVERDSNSYTIDGTDYNLTSVTDESDDYVNFTVEHDYSSTVDAVSKFVDAFNTLLTKLTTLTNATDYSSDYPPLTDAQQEEMTDDQISTWNEKAKNGILRHNSDLENLISNLKETFFSAAGGTGKNSTSIGLSTGSYFDSSNKGLIVLDEDALTSALKTNPDEVVSIFTGGSSSSSSAQQGLIYKMKNALSAYQDTADNSVSNTEDKIDKIDDTVDDLQDKLESMAEKYYEKFSNMETALSKLNSQASYLSQLFS